MALKRSGLVRSPTELEKSYKNPMAYVMDKWVMQRYQTDLLQGGAEGILGTVENVDGKHVHKALEESFDFLKTIKNPSSKEIKNHLHHAFKLAEKYLDAQGLPVSEHRSFLKSIIDEHGGEALNKRSLGVGSIDIMPEMPVYMPLDMSIDRALKGKWKANPIGSVLRGSADLAIVDTAKKVGTIVDYKNLFSAESADMLRRSIERGETFQPKVYALDLFNKYTKDEMDKVKFQYELSVPGKGGERTRETLTIEYNRSQYENGKLQKEIMEQVARVESMQHTIFNTMRNGDIQSLKKYIVDNLPDGCNPPHSCSFCPLKRTCTHGPFAEKVLNPREGLEGSETTATKAKKLKSYQDPEFVQKQSDLYDKRTQTKVDQFIERKTKELQKKGYRGAELDKRVASEADALRESYGALKRYTRGRYMDSAVTSSVSARTKIPFSLIDSDGLHAPWLSKKSRASLEYLSKGRIKEITDALDVKHELVTDKVLERVYQDEDFAVKLENYMAEKYRNAIEKHGLPYENKSILKLQLRPDLVMDRHFAQMIQGELDRATVGEVLRQDGANLEQYLNKLDPKRFRTQTNIQSITAGLVDSGIIKDNPDLFLKKLARGGSFGSIREKFRLSAKKFPLTAAMSTFFLSYLAGTSTIQSMVMRKMEKATEYMAGQQDGKVRDGQHSAAYTTARRLLLSDFGSARRFLNPRSGLISELMTGLSKKFKSFADDAILAKALADKGATEAIETGTGRTIRNFMANLGESPAGPAAIFVGASAAAFLVTGPGVNIKTGEQRGREYEERKKRFKRLKRSTWNKDSAMIAKESRLREAYKMHTDFGSGVFQASRFMATITTEMITPGFLTRFFDTVRKGLYSARQSLMEMAGTGISKYREYTAVNEQFIKNPMIDRLSIERTIKQAKQTVEAEINKFRGTNLKDNIKKTLVKESSEAAKEKDTLQKALDRGFLTITAVDMAPGGTPQNINAPIVSNKSLFGYGTHGRRTEALRFKKRKQRAKKYYTDEKPGKVYPGAEYEYHTPGKRFHMPTAPGRKTEYLPYSLESPYEGIRYKMYKGTQLDQAAWYSGMMEGGITNKEIYHTGAISSQPAYYSTAEQFTTSRVSKYRRHRPVEVSEAAMYRDRPFAGNNPDQNRIRHSRYITSVTMDSSGMLKGRKYSYNQAGGNMFFDAINSVNGIGWH